MSDKSISNFAESFSKSSQSMGTLKRAIPSVMISEDITRGRLTGQAKEFYSGVYMGDMPTLRGDFFFQLFSVAELETAQDGWNSVGSEEVDLGWKDSYVVFADRNGDALAFDSSCDVSPVYGSIQKRSFLISNSFFGFLDAIVFGVDIEESDFQGDTRLDDMSYKSLFISKVEQKLSSSSKEIDVDGFMRFFFD